VYELEFETEAQLRLIDLRVPLGAVPVAEADTDDGVVSVSAT
jgi:hypothetical protein